MQTALLLTNQPKRMWDSGGVAADAKTVRAIVTGLKVGVSSAAAVATDGVVPAGMDG
jgi:hypothetical protein